MKPVGLLVERLVEIKVVPMANRYRCVRVGYKSIGETSCGIEHRTLHTTKL